MGIDPEECIHHRDVYERDGWKCVRCSSHIRLTLDHVVPKSLGGRSTAENLQVLCFICNQWKAARTIRF